MPKVWVSHEVQELQDFVKLKLPILANAEMLHNDVSLLVRIKIMLWNELLSQGKTRADLARLLKTSQVTVDRIFDFDHPSKLDTLEKVAKLLGRKLTVNFA